MYAVWLVEEFLDTLGRAGFEPEMELHALRTLNSFAVGYVMAEIRDFAFEPGGSRLGARQLTAEEFPRIFELRPHLDGVDRDAEFEFGLDLILCGLKARI